MPTIKRNNPDNLTYWARALLRAKEENILLTRMREHRGIHQGRAQSSNGDAWYLVTVDLRNGLPVATCSCMAGQHDMICKHAALAIDKVLHESFGPRLMTWISRAGFEEMEEVA